MTYEQLCGHYGNANLAAKALGYTRQAISNWKYRGGIPKRTQDEIERRTRGALKAANGK